MSHVKLNYLVNVQYGNLLICLVAQQLIRKHNHIINLENKEIALKACPVALTMGTTFKVIAS